MDMTIYDDDPFETLREDCLGMIGKIDTMHTWEDFSMLPDAWEKLARQRASLQAIADGEPVTYALVSDLVRAQNFLNMFDFDTGPEMPMNRTARRAAVRGRRAALQASRGRR